MGGHHGRVCISRDVDPQLTHTVQAIPEYLSGWNVEERGDEEPAKQRNRKLSRRSRSRSRKRLDKGASKKNEAPQEEMHMMNHGEEDETHGKHSMRDKLVHMLVRKQKGNFGSTKSLDKVTKQQSLGSNSGEERRVKPSKRVPNEKCKQRSTSPAAIIRTEDSMESDCFKSTHMESIVEEEGTRRYSKKKIVRPSCVIQ